MRNAFLLDCLYAPAAILTAPWWMRKQRAGWDERFARRAVLTVPPAAGGVKRILLHAVSVGEVNTLRGLVPLLSKDAEVVVSVSTDTGIARARALWPGAAAEVSGHAVHVVRYPLDFSGAVRRFMDAVRPDAVGLVELELWPNFIGECRRRGVPVCVINGRLSSRSFRNYRRFRPLLRSTFAALEFAAVQDEDYAARFRHMGVAPERVRVTGSMKWDSVRVPREGEAVPPVAGAEELRAAIGLDSSKPLVVAGSTGPLPQTIGPIARLREKHASPGCIGREFERELGEEWLLDEACGTHAQLLCAPRKPERFEQAFGVLGGDNRCRRRSKPPWKNTPAHRGEATRYLLDTIGELRAAYALADLCIVGRSFGDLYGSDPIEPVSLGKPTIIGPSHSDFATIVDALRKAGGIVVCSADDLEATIRNLLADPAKRKNLAERGLACIRAQQGATARHAAMLLSLLGVRATPM